MGTHPIFESDFDCLTDFACTALASSGALPADFRPPCQVQVRGHFHFRGAISATNGSRNKAAVQKTPRLFRETSTNLSAFSDSRRKTPLGKRETCFTPTDADFDKHSPPFCSPLFT